MNGIHTLLFFHVMPDRSRPKKMGPSFLQLSFNRIPPNRPSVEPERLLRFLCGAGAGFRRPGLAPLK